MKLKTRRTKHDEENERMETPTNKQPTKQMEKKILIIKKRYLKGGGIHIHIQLRKEIYLKNQMVTSEIKKKKNNIIVKILIISPA